MKEIFPVLHAKLVPLLIVRERSTRRSELASVTRITADLSTNGDRTKSFSSLFGMQWTIRRCYRLIHNSSTGLSENSIKQAYENNNHFPCVRVLSKNLLKSPSAIYLNPPAVENAGKGFSPCYSQTLRNRRILYIGYLILGDLSDGRAPNDPRSARRENRLPSPYLAYEAGRTLSAGIPGNPGTGRKLSGSLL